MIKKIYLYILFFLINNLFFLKIKFKKIKKINYNYDFTFVSFKNLSELKKILVSKNTIFNVNQNKYYEYHSLDWLWAAKQVGGTTLVKIARDKVIDWNITYKNFKYNRLNIILSPKRLINLIYYYDFFASSANIKEKFKINFIIYCHYIFLNFLVLFDNKATSNSIEINKAILLFQSIHDLTSSDTIKRIKNKIRTNINQSGMHYSMNPDFHADFLNHLVEIKNICLFFKINVPKEISFQIINMTSVLKNFFHKDNSFALFNGSSNNNIDDIKKIILLIGDIKTKNLINNKNGIAIYDNGQLKIFFDVVKPENKLINYNLHASTLSFELSFKNEKIVTNCGTIEKRNFKQPDYLRYSAAHSTIILNNTNISELVEKKSYKRIPSNIIFNFKELKNNINWEASHDGYTKNYKKIVKRNLLIAKKDCEVVGQDQIISSRLSDKKINYSIRFHLTPICKALLTRGMKSVIIKTEKNNSFIFKSDSTINLEESIYIESGKRIIKTFQIVISGSTNDKKKIINWSLSLKN